MGKSEKVSYIYDSTIGQHYYGIKHPMKPYRVCMTNDLILEYGLDKHLVAHDIRLASADELEKFHTKEYIEFLESTAQPPANKAAQKAFERQRMAFNLDDECPVFDGLYRFCQMYSGASLKAARQLNAKAYTIAINWAGGLHHAKHTKASGFCYVNDLVLAICELLKCHRRVLYLDLDIHHGDGVEEAFIATDSVMTVSFHRHGDGFFPSTGHPEDNGFGYGKKYSLNIPFNKGLTNEQFWSVFEPVMKKVMEKYQPEAIVLQCGADSLCNDRLGDWNLSIRQHAAAVELMKSYNLPMLVTGGGGYNKRAVAKCWAYETAVLVGQKHLVTDKLPGSDVLIKRFLKEKYFGSREVALNGDRMNLDRRGFVQTMNTEEELDATKVKALEQLRSVAPAPGTGLSHLRPKFRCKDAEEKMQMESAVHDYALQHRMLDDFKDADFLLPEKPNLWPKWVRPAPLHTHHS